MSCRQGCILLTMVAGLAPLGCANWQPCWMRSACPMGGCCPAQPAAAPQAAAPQPAPAPAPQAVAAGELTAAQSAQLCLAAAESLQKKGYTAEAIAQYEKARAHDAGAHVARRLAVLYDLQGDTARAEAEYGRAMQEQPGDAELLNDLGYFHYRHDRLDVAEGLLRKAVEANPGCACAWTNLGQVLARRGRLEESYEAFAKVLRPAEAYSNLGVVLAKQGRTAEARQMLQKALSLDPTLKQPQAFLGALPPAPALLPPGITHTPQPAEPTVNRERRPAGPAVNVDDLPTVIVPARTSAARPVPTLADPMPLRPAVIATAAPVPPPPAALPPAPAFAPAGGDFRPAAAVPPAPEMPLTQARWAPPPPPPPPAQAGAAKADDADLPIIINQRPQPSPVSTYTAPKPTPAPARAPAAPKAPAMTPATAAAPRVLHLDDLPAASVPVKKEAPCAVLIDCTATPE